MNDRQIARSVALDVGTVGDVLPDETSDAVLSDDEFIHLAVALQNLRWADASGGESDTPGRLLSALQSNVEALAERRFDQLTGGDE